jgi:flagellar basal-body rod protein FlgF/flagellar basal-body rod protein FlgG
MVSGKYSALAGAISREQMIANISANLANVSTSGYKKSLLSFESLLRGERQTAEARGINYNRVRQNFTDFSPGPLRQTENPYDLALAGEGLFKVQGADGILYTRRGDFIVDGEGVLRTTNGLPVLDAANGQITIPDTATGKVAVSEAGIIYLLTPDGARAEVAQLAVVDVDDRNKLKRSGDTTFTLEDGGVENPLENPVVVQGSLEVSNVSMVEEMTGMIDSYRLFETYHKVLKSYSTISEQQEELGTLG